MSDIKISNSGTASRTNASYVENEECKEQFSAASRVVAKQLSHNEKVRVLHNIFQTYQHAINEIDDYFEYFNESLKDREVVQEILDRLSSKLEEIKNNENQS
jgi:hypothetical protein